jgi:hypothetical protein
MTKYPAIFVLPMKGEASDPHIFLSLLLSIFYSISSSILHMSWGGGGVVGGRLLKILMGRVYFKQTPT